MVCDAPDLRAPPIVRPLRVNSILLKHVALFLSQRKYRKACTLGTAFDSSLAQRAIVAADHTICELCPGLVMRVFANSSDMLSAVNRLSPDDNLLNVVLVSSHGFSSNPLRAKGRSGGFCVKDRRLIGDTSCLLQQSVAVPAGPDSGDDAVNFFG